LPEAAPSDDVKIGNWAVGTGVLCLNTDLT